MNGGGLTCMHKAEDMFDGLMQFLDTTYNIVEASPTTMHQP